MFKTYWTMGLAGSDEAFALRRGVFADELGVENAFDENDAISAHLIVILDDVPIASSRMYPYNGGVIIDKACVKKEHRGQGFGDLLTRVMLDKARNMGTPKVYADVPEKYIDYYKAFGFLPDDGLMSVSPEEIDWHPACSDS